MSRIMVGGLVALLLVSTAAAEPVPAPFTAYYEVSRGDMKLGEQRLSLSREANGTFVFESLTRATGMAAVLTRYHLLERSRWQYVQRSIRPDNYYFEKRGAGSNRKVQIEFDWETGRATNTIGEDSWSMDVPAGTLDKLVYILDMMRDLRSGQRKFEYRIADGGKLKTYRFAVLQNELLETPLGRIDALKVQRLRKSRKRETLVWCAPVYGYLPVRIDQREKDGSAFSSVISAVEGLSADAR